MAGPHLGRVENNPSLDGVSLSHSRETLGPESRRTRHKIKWDHSRKIVPAEWASSFSASENRVRFKNADAASCRVVGVVPGRQLGERRDIVKTRGGISHAHIC